MDGWMDEGGGSREQGFRNRWALRLLRRGLGEGEEAWRNWNCYKVAS